MRMSVYNIIEKREKSRLFYYLYAIILGIFIFLALLLIFKGGFFLIRTVVKFVIDYWMFILGGLAGILILRKVVFRRRVQQNVMQHSEM